MPKSFLIAREEMPGKSDTKTTTSSNVNRSASTAHEDAKVDNLTAGASANEEWRLKKSTENRNLWLDTLDDDCLSSDDEDQNDLEIESNSKLPSKKDVCSPSRKASSTSSHGMSSSELGRVIRADHDYIELLVNVKTEDESSESEEEEELKIVPEVPIDIKEEVVIANTAAEKEEAKDMFDNLATLAEVSLATAGQLEDKSLKRKIDQARAKISRTILPITPEMSSKRTMQITLPENTTHIVICTSGDASPPKKDPKKEVIRTVVKSTNNNNYGKKEGRLKAAAATNALDHAQDSGKQEYECGECGKRYSTSSNLARHKQTHRSLTDKKAKKCSICGKIYVSMPAFAMHMRTHNQNCKCSICGKAFSRPWLLQGHVRTHTGERPYKCSLCPKAFADKSNLRAHTQTHSNSKPFECRHCGKTFALKSYLYKHEEASCSFHNNPASNKT